jgi:hypothetical protein
MGVGIHIGAGVGLQKLVVLHRGVIEMADRVKIEILEDGQIKIETPGISGANHCSADELLSEIARLAGGERIRQKTRPGHVHVVNGQKQYHKH